MQLRYTRSAGFTLIELLVVMAIIALLASSIFASLNSARAKARDAYRRASMKQIQVALALYYDDHRAYPSTSGAWWGMSVNGGSHPNSGASAYVPGVVPTYMPVLPADPSGRTDAWSGFLYKSDGVNYKLLVHQTGPESFPASGQPFYDPKRPTWAWMLCNSEPACSSW